MNLATTIEQKIQKGMFDFFYKHNRSNLTNTFHTPKPANAMTRFAAIHKSVLGTIEQHDFERAQRVNNNQFDDISEQKKPKKHKIRKSNQRFIKMDSLQKSTLAAIWEPLTYFFLLINALN